VTRVAAYCLIVSAYVIGGGSLALFGAFLVVGPFAFVRFDASQSQVLIWDGFLSVLFFVQHSGMVRAPFRSWLASALPRSYHAAVYAVASGTVLAGVVFLWQTSSTVLFRIQGPLQWLPRTLCLLALAGFVWAILALRTFDPFGRIPIMVELRGKPLRSPEFVLRGPYLWVRHPLYFFVLVLIWSASEVTSDRLFFNLLWTGWIVVATMLEERDLVAEFGEGYRRYQRTVPMLLPWRRPVGAAAKR